jgi:hypothetical protein
MSSEGDLQLRRSRHHEAQPCVLLGEFALNIEKARAGNMCGLERVQPGYSKIRDVASGRLVIEAGRTIENTKVGLMQNSRKLFRANEFGAHRIPPTAILEGHASSKVA